MTIWCLDFCTTFLAHLDTKFKILFENFPNFIGRSWSFLKIPHLYLAKFLLTWKSAEHDLLCNPFINWCFTTKKIFLFCTMMEINESDGARLTSFAFILNTLVPAILLSKNYKNKCNLSKSSKVFLACVMYCLVHGVDITARPRGTLISVPKRNSVSQNSASWGIYLFSTVSKCCNISVP